MQSRLEEMGSFFDTRVEGYDEHMLGMFQDFNLFYETVASPIMETQNVINILDLGCGTGAELRPIFNRVPKAKVTAIDVSEKMLGKLLENYASFKRQIGLICGSYLSVPFEEKAYDYAMSVYTMHHFTEEVKLSLYRRIASALKPGGKYIEGDCVVTPEKQQEVWAWYAAHYSAEHIQAACDVESALYHIDIPCTVDTQLRLLQEAGFSKVELIWHREPEESAIFVAEV